MTSWKTKEKINDGIDREHWLRAPDITEQLICGGKGYVIIVLKRVQRCVCRVDGYVGEKGGGGGVTSLRLKSAQYI